MPSKKAEEAARRLIVAAEHDEGSGSPGWWNRHEDAIAEALDAERKQIADEFYAFYVHIFPHVQWPPAPLPQQQRGEG